MSRLSIFTGLSRALGVTIHDGISDFIGVVASIIAALGVPENFLLKEDGDFLLLETGDKIGLEG